ncbi:hypothetical protein GCM10010912_58480 [Paenibacillus albidus]|uniref:Uncharacterized protein n=1 Tax=Paenibacillus albidus TaxID=2041023 RepID=A0A917D1D7_9BACL|nr:hypothetical protein [Paenibacillus albidus]GGG06164.1 hypothetical protein GCM10010912_58480 [Paenibacillus albidus]
MSKNRKKVFLSFMVLALLLPGFVIRSDGAFAAESKAIKDLFLSQSYSYTGKPYVQLQDDVTVTDKGSVAGFKKYIAITPSKGVTAVGLTGAGELYTLDATNNRTLITSNVNDFTYTYRAYSDGFGGNFYYASFYIIKNDGTAYAWGDNTGGQLGIGGPNQDKLTPTPIVDAQDNELTGVKKIIRLTIHNKYDYKNTAIYLITDSGAYVLGSLEGTTVNHAVKDTAFPAFSGANQVSYKYMGEFDRDPGLAIQTVWSAKSLIWTINGVDYTVYDLYSTNPAPGYYALPKTFSYLYTPTPENNTLTLGVTGGEMSVWSKSTPKYTASGVIKGHILKDGTYSYLKTNGRIYFVGDGMQLGISGSFPAETRFSGTSNELTDVVDYRVTYGVQAALKKDGNLVIWSNGATKILDKKFTKLYQPAGAMGVIYSLSVDGGIYQITPSGYTLISSDYTYAAPDGLDLKIPVPVGTQSVNKFKQTVVTIDYGKAKRKEYSVDGGKTWVHYTQPVLLTETGTISLSARGGDTQGNFSDVLLLSIVNNPIVIEAGHPKIVDNGNGSFAVETGTTSPDAKTEVRIDNGTWFEYSGPVTLAVGSHNIEVRIINLEGETLASGQQMINGPTPAPTVSPTATPVPTVEPTTAPSPVPTSVPTASPLPTVVPSPTATPAPTATPVPTVAPTQAPQPTMDPTWGQPIGSEDVTFTVLSGGFSSRFSGLLLDNVTISTTNPYQAINSVTQSVIEDSRGTGAGWNYSLKITDFVSDPVVDNSKGSNDLVVKMPTNSLSVDVTPSTTLAGQPGDLSLSGNYVFNSEAIVLARANEFQGMGQYQIPMSYNLRVPDKVEIVSAGAGSSYQAGEKTGLRVGTYRSQFTFTLASGI